MAVQVPSTFPEDAMMRHGSEDSTNENPSPFFGHITDFHSPQNQREGKSGPLNPVDSIQEVLREKFQKQPRMDGNGAVQKGSPYTHLDKRPRFSSSPQSERHLDLSGLNLADLAGSSELGDSIPSSSRSRASHQSRGLGSKHRGVKPRYSNTQTSRKKRHEKHRLHLPDVHHQPQLPVFSRSTAVSRSEIPETEDDSGIQSPVDLWPSDFQSPQPNVPDDDSSNSLFVTPGPPSPRHRHNINSHHHNHHHHHPDPTVTRRHERPPVVSQPPLPPPNAPFTTNNPDDNPTHRARLRAMASNPHAHPYVRKLAPEKDAENVEIKRLRTRERLHWEEIAARMNGARVAAGRAPTFTVAAVYGRFARVAPRIAEDEGDAAFDYRDFLNFRHPRRDGEGERERPMPVLSGVQEEVLVRCYEEVERERWVNVARKFKMVASVELTPEQVARKWKSL